MPNTLFNGFTPPPPTPQSVPSGVVSPTPDPQSIPLDTTPTPPSSNHPSFVPPSLPSVDYSQPPSVPSGFYSTPDPPSFGPHDRLTSENLHLLDGLANPNISGTSRPHPNQLSRDFCVAACQKFYVVTVGWEVGIFDTWGIARTRVQSVSNNSYQSFSNWEDAVHYYTQCFMDDCIEIRDPKLPTPKKPHGIGTNSRPITVTPSTPTPHGIGADSQRITVPSSAGVLPTHNPLNSKTRVRKGKATQKYRPIVIMSSDSEDGDTPITKQSLPATRTPPISLGRRRRIIIIDEVGEEIELSDTDGKPCRETKRFRMDVHTMRIEPSLVGPSMSRPEVPSDSLGPGQTVPLPVRQYNIAVNCSEAGVATPPGTFAQPPAGPSRSKPTRKSNCNKGSDYQVRVSDFEPELLAALCKGM